MRSAEGAVNDGGGVVLASRLLDGHWCGLVRWANEDRCPKEAFRHHVSVATSDCQVYQHATLLSLDLLWWEICVATCQCRMQRSATVEEMWTVSGRSNPAEPHATTRDLQ